MAIKSKPTQLNGINPLSYIGVNPYTPPGMYQLPRNPTVRDNAGFQIGDFWINSINNDLWYLAKKSNAPQYQDALWIQLGGGDLESLTGDVGGPVFPDVNGNINTLGTLGQILVTGNPGTNTLTWSLDGSVATEYVCNTDSAIPALGILNVLGNTYINTTGFGNTIEIDVTGDIAAQYPTDAGTAVPVGNILNIFGGTAGRDINTTGVGDTVRVELNNAISLGDLAFIPVGTAALTIDSGDIIMTGSDQDPTTNPFIRMGDSLISFYLNNIFLGFQAGNLTMTPGVALFNQGIGPFSLKALTTGTQNVGYGNATLANCTSGQNNCAIGYTSCVGITTGTHNVAIGVNTLGSTLAGLKTGTYNTALGSLSGRNYTGSESDNILINNEGVVGESNICRIGAATGTGTQELTDMYLAGLVYADDGLVVSNNDATIVQGNFNMTAGTNAGGTEGIFTYAGERYISNFGILNQFVGATSGNLTLTGTQNTGVGRGCLQSLTTGQNNNAFGLTAGLNVTTGSNNALLGQSGVYVTTGDDNTMLGHEAGCNIAGVTGITTGSYNTLVGSSAGDAYTSSESNNIVIGARVPGTVGESNVCRIASGTGTGTGQINKTFIAGIRGITTTNNNAIAVLIDSAGQLGTVSSSARYKENIQDMGTSSEAIMQLRPVVFNYKDDASQSQRFGLIAEEVAEIFPYLTAMGNDGQPESVKYHELAAILLNEVQKLSRRVAELENR